MPHRNKTTRVAALVLVLASAALGASACSSSAPAQSAKTTSCSDFATLIAAAVSGNNGATDQATTLKNGQALAQNLTQEAAAATDPNAKTAMAAFAADYTSLVGAIGKADAGDKAAAADVTTISAKVTTDSAAVKSVCGN